MSYTFEAYKDRKIDFHALVETKGWKVKVYTITNREFFESATILETVLNALPGWLEEAERSKIPTHASAFLIVHEAREGVLTLINWWTGGEMVETRIFFSSFDKPEEVVKSPYHPSALVCIWELQVFAHERKAWIENILASPENPDFDAYYSDVLIQQQ